MKEHFQSNMYAKMREWWQWMIAKRYIYVVLASVAIIALVIGSVAAFGPRKGSPTQALAKAYSSSEPVPLIGSLPKALATAKPTGAVAVSQPLQISISLQLRNTTQLATLLASQNDPKSSQYHKYLQPQDFLTQFAPTAADVAAVSTFLKSAGFQVKSVSANRLLINASGTVAQANKAFAVTLSTYQLGKRQVYAPQQNPLLSQKLAGIVENISGLDNVSVAHPLLTTNAGNAVSSPHPRVQDPSPIGGFAPNDLRTAYQVTPLITNGGNGSTQSVAILELAPYIAGDIQAYRTQYGLPNSAINSFTIDGGNGTDNYGTSEADLDLQVVSALAPNATQNVYNAPNTTSSLNDAYSLFATMDHDKIMTTSWGLCEPYSGQDELRTLDNIFAQAAVQGQTIFAAAGDAGSDDCYDRVNDVASGLSPSVDSPADDPYVLGVGGTTLSYNGTYNGESVWNTVGSPGAGGGGVSSYFSKPSWQVGVGVNNSYAQDQREVPDVTADADPIPGYAFYCTSQYDCADSNGSYGWVYTGGTSAAAPLWAGILSDINTYLQNNGKSTFGWANQRLYQLFAYSVTNRSTAYGMFNDITSGNNNIDYTQPPYQGDYPATTCYDLTSGMGSPNAWNLAQVAASGTSGTTGPCAAAAATTTELINAGSFEGNPVPSVWQQYSMTSNSQLIDSYHVHTGQASFTACMNVGQCDDRIWQNLTIPATVKSAKLRYWFASNTDFAGIGVSGTPPCAGHFYVTLATPDGTVFDTVRATCAADTYGYVELSSDVTSYLVAHAGQTVQIMFRGVANNIAYSNGVNNAISWSVDDVSLAVS